MGCWIDNIKLLIQVGYSNQLFGNHRQLVVGMSLRHINLLLSLNSCGLSIHHFAQVCVTTPNFFYTALFFGALNQTLHLNRILAVYV
jgi:hypothetical protein